MTSSPKQALHYQTHFTELKEKLSFKSLCGNPPIIDSWAAVHLVFAHDGKGLEDGLKLAMIRRTEKKEDPWSGHYAFPGGRAEPKEDLYQTSIRETFEEVGLELKDSQYLGEFLHMQLRHKGQDLPYAISAHASYLERPVDLTPCPDEVDESFWFSLKDLHQEEHLMERDFNLGDRTLKLPCLSFSGHTIWGISYLILREIYRQLDGEHYRDQGLFKGNFLPSYPYGKRL